eukprot:CAMPEP_0116094394 /NCGR_PEP_ID=MMETSP0327-20121206/9107_1 /TAXON_ID=44447 /ORGANISM="Pseudo-nitzschia delicatissima, Strain B596" /LENGTH=270 /DNA_ID=CAMNT_0003585993 /DNA_START=47 /DNA_END=859 /DNA_ORIENTATION=+
MHATKFVSEIDSEREFRFGSHKIASSSSPPPSSSSVAGKSILKASTSKDTDKQDKDIMAKSNSRPSSKKSINTSVRRMDQVPSSSKQEAAIGADRLEKESKAIRRFANVAGLLCVVLVVTVFGIDIALLEEIASLVVHNVVAAAGVLIFGLNVAGIIYDRLATPVPGSPEDLSPSTPLQGLVRRPSQGRPIPLQRRPERPVSITVPSAQKRNSGGLFGGLWPKKKKRSSKNKNQPHEVEQPSPSRKQSKKSSVGRRRGWSSGRLSSAGSI